MGLHVYQGGQWRNFCNDEVTLSIYKDGVAEALHRNDYIYANGQWQTVCPEPNYPFGFDMVNRSIYVTPDFPNPTQFQHIVRFENSTDDYPWGGANDFTLRSNIEIQVAEEVQIQGKTPLGAVVWQFGPQSTPGTYNQVYDFPMSAANYYMEIDAQFKDGDYFSIQCEVLAGSGGSEYLDFSGIPFPTNYESTD